MIMKYVQFKWTLVEKEALENIKATIVVSLSLRSLDFTKDFLLHIFAFDHSLVAVLT